MLCRVCPTNPREAPGLDPGAVHYGDIEHQPWLLAPAWAELEGDSLFQANGFDRPTAEPTFHFAAPIDVTADQIRRLQS